MDCTVAEDLSHVRLCRKLEKQPIKTVDLRLILKINLTDKVIERIITMLSPPKKKLMQ